MRKRTLLLALMASACSPVGQSTSNISNAAAPAEAKSGYALRSNVAGASLVQVAELATVTPLEVDRYCANRFVKPTSDAGGIAAGKGWRILRELPFHGLHAVLIVRGLDPMTSGRCNSIDANIAFFEGTRLVGVLYPKGKRGIAISMMTLDNGHVRVWSPDPMVQGQVSLNGHDLTFDKISGGDPVCNGKYQVPAVFTEPYPKARAKLLAAGWMPRPSSEGTPDRLDLADYRKRYPELDYCAGTGYGECSFTLAAKDGVTTLTIGTIGDIPDAVVSDYSVACDGKPAD